MQGSVLQRFLFGNWMLYHIFTKHIIFLFVHINQRFYPFRIQLIELFHKGEYLLQVALDGRPLLRTEGEFGQAGKLIYKCIIYLHTVVLNAVKVRNTPHHTQHTFYIFAAMQRVLSGIRSTGHLHLGNYFGAVRNFINLQDTHECYFFVANIHSLTTHPDPEELTNNVQAVLTEYIACGLDPKKSVIYIQSDLPETYELYTLLNMLAYKGELEKCTSFKEKVKKHHENINAGLLTYPVLMAADILIHRAHLVPVGKDQEQHLEMTRNFAVRFNHRYGVDFFPEPQAFDFSGKLIKVPGLDGSGKMGKVKPPVMPFSCETVMRLFERR